MEKRNTALDILRFVCAIMVVAWHIPLSYDTLWFPVVYSSVPCFFILSGYLSYDEEQDKILKRLRKSTKKIFITFIWATLLCAVDDIYRYLRGVQTIHIKQFVYFLLFNENPFAFHLWYLGAYLYVLCIMYVICNTRYKKIVIGLLALMGFAIPILGEYNTFQVSAFLFRSWLFPGLPCFCIGMLIHRYEQKTVMQLPLAVVIMLGGLVLIFMYLYPFNLMLTTTICAVLLFLLALKYRYGSENIFSKIGAKDVLYIYILHPIFTKIFYTSYFSINHYLHYVLPIVVFALAELLVISCRISIAYFQSKITLFNGK